MAGWKLSRGYSPRKTGNFCKREKNRPTKAGEIKGGLQEAERGIYTDRVIMSDDLHLKIHCEFCGKRLQYMILERSTIAGKYLQVHIDPTACGCFEAYKQEIEKIIREA